MKCDFCDQKASVFLTQLADGEMKKHSLCEQCAEQRGVTDPLNLSMNQDFFKDPKATAPDGGPAIDLQSLFTDSSDQKCQACGFTLADLKKIGRLGCPSCYDVYRSEIVPNLEKMHKGSRHIGQSPKGMREELEKRKVASVLQELLDQAVKDENYEFAAEIKAALENPNTDEALRIASSHDTFATKGAAQ